MPNQSDFDPPPHIQDALDRLAKPTRARTRQTQNPLAGMLWAYRTFQRQTLREFAQQIGISHATLARIEGGHDFDTATLLKLWTWMIQPAPVVDESPMARMAEALRQKAESERP